MSKFLLWCGRGQCECNANALITIFVKPFELVKLTKLIRAFPNFLYDSRKLELGRNNIQFVIINCLSWRGRGRHGQRQMWKNPFSHSTTTLHIRMLSRKSILSFTFRLMRAQVEWKLTNCWNIKGRPGKVSFAPVHVPFLSTWLRSTKVFISFSFW